MHKTTSGKHIVRVFGIKEDFEGAFNIAEKIERLRERKDKDLLSMKDDIERE